MFKKYDEKDQEVQDDEIFTNGLSQDVMTSVLSTGRGRFSQKFIKLL